MSAPTKSRVEWGTARIEIAALREEIVAGLQAGRSLRAIYRSLREADRIVASERQFYRDMMPIRDAFRREQSDDILSPTSPTANSPDIRHIRSVDNAASNPTPNHQSVIDPRPQVGDEDTGASTSVVPLSGRSRAAGGFTLNRDFNPEE